MRRYHYENDADNMKDFLESVEAGRVDIFDVPAVAPGILDSNSWIKALFCMLVQILVPIILIAATLTRLLHPRGTPEWNWQGLCNPTKAWSNPQILLKIANKTTSGAILMYTNYYITKLMWDLNEKPMNHVLTSDMCYKRLKKPLWAVREDEIPKGTTE